MERVKSADVLDPTHEARSAYRGEVLGYFDRMGPNAWDDYQFVNSGNSSPVETVDVLPGVPLQLEPRGAVVRMRSKGRVVRVRWVASESDHEALGSEPEPRAIRQHFVEHYLVPRGSESALGATAVIVNKIRE